MQEQNISKNTSAAADEPEDFAQAAADLMQKIEADKDQVVEINFDKMQVEYLEQCKNTLYEHLPEGIVIGNAADLQNPDRMLEKDELWDGELEAALYQVGCYSVRCSLRLYRKWDDVTPQYHLDAPNLTAGLNANSKHEANGVPAEYYRPATREEFDQYWNEIKNPSIWGGGSTSDFMKVNEVFAAYVGDGRTSEYRYVCHTEYAEFSSYTDTVSFIGTVKIGATEPDHCADLFVGTCYTGSSYSVESWYSVSPDGQTSEYCIHGMNPDSWDKKWDWKGYHSDLK